MFFVSFTRQSSLFKKKSYFLGCFPTQCNCSPSKWPKWLITGVLRWYSKWGCTSRINSPMLATSKLHRGHRDLYCRAHRTAQGNPRQSFTRYQKCGYLGPYVRLFGGGAPLDMPYPYSLYRWGFLHFCYTWIAWSNFDVGGWRLR